MSDRMANARESYKAQRMRVLGGLVLGGLVLGGLMGSALPALGQATLQVGNANLPVSQAYNYSSQTVTLTIANADVVLNTVQTAAGYYNFSVQSNSCFPNGNYVAVAAGTVCNLTVSFYPTGPGWGSAPAPIGQWAPLVVSYYDTVLNQTLTQSFALTGTGTAPRVAISPGVISDLVGNDVAPSAGFGGDGGAASGALFTTPGGIAMDVVGNIYIADTGNNVIRMIYAAGNFPELTSAPTVGDIYTIAGVAPTGGGSSAGAGVDGVLATSSKLNGPTGVALDANGNLYIADNDNNAVRVVNAITGVITTVAGKLNAGPSYAGDFGAATAASLTTPSSVVVDGFGNLYIADTDNNAIRAVYVGGAELAALIATEKPGTTATVGDIYSLAGAPSNPAVANNGDGGLASAANLNFPTGVTVDSVGNLYIADQKNKGVRRVDSTSGNISTVYQGGDSPVSVAIDSADEVYFTQKTGCTISRYNPTPQSYGAMAPLVVAGNGVCGASGDGGSSIAAGLAGALGVTVDGSGNIYALEADGVRKIAAQNGAINFAAQNVGTISPAQAAILTDVDIVYPANANQNANTSPYVYFYNLQPPFSSVAYASSTLNDIDCNGTLNGNSVYLFAGQSCGAAFVFSPMADGAAATVEAVSNANIYVALSGTGMGPLPTATLTGPAVSLTSIVNETQVYAPVLTLKNTSSVILSLGYIQILPFQNFGTSDTCGFTYATNPTLAPGASCTITVSFEASTTGVTNATLTVFDNASSGGGQQSFPLMGTGIAPLGVFSPSPLSFNLIAPGTTVSMPVTLTNSGTATLNIDTAGFSLAGNNPGNFAIANNPCGATLAINANCVITISFTPTTYAYYSADLDVQDDSGGVRIYTQGGVKQYQYITQDEHMVGSTGNPPEAATFAIGNGIFPATAVGASTTQTVTVTLNNAVALKSIVPAPGFTEYSVGAITGCTIDGATVNPAGTVCNLPVTFTPAYPGLRNTPLLLTDIENGTALPYQLGMSGTGLGPLAALTPGIVTSVVGSGDGYADPINGADGPAANALTGFSTGFAMDTVGNEFISDDQNCVIWKVDLSRNIHIYAGSPCGIYIQGVGGDGGTALGSRIAFAGPLAVDSKGGLYLANNTYGNYGSPNEIRYIDAASGLITDAVGFTTPQTWASMTAFFVTARLQVKVSGTVYLFTAQVGGTSGGSQPAWPTGTGASVQDGTVLWQNQGVYFGGPGCAAQTDSLGDGCTASQVTVGPFAGVIVDPAGNLYFSDNCVNVEVQFAGGCSSIRRVDAVTKKVTMFAGTGTAGHNGDGGPANAAQVSAGDLAFDGSGNLYFSEIGYVRKIDMSTGNISTIAGNGVNTSRYETCSGATGDGGLATAAGFGEIASLAIDPANNIYLADAGNCTIRRIDAGTGVIVTVGGYAPGGGYTTENVGFGDLGQNGADGDALNAASFSHPYFLRLDGNASIYIGGGFGGVRKIDVTQSVLSFTGSSYPANGNTVTEYNQVTPPATATVLNAGNAGAVTFTTPFLSSPAWGNSANWIRDFTNPTGVSDCYEVGSIAIGTECPISVDYDPQSGSGFVSGTNTVNDNAITGGGSQVITLYGKTDGVTPQVLLTPATLNFSTPQGGGSMPQMLTLTNNTSTALPIASIGFTGSGAAQFTYVSHCGASLAATSNCTINVYFMPTVLASSSMPPPDNVNAVLNVNDTATDLPSPQTSQMFGVGTLPAVSRTTPQIDWVFPSSIVYGTPLNSTYLDAYAVIPATTTMLPGAMTYTPPAGTILPGGTNMLQAVFTPNDTADYTDATDTVSLFVSPATPTITWTPSASTVVQGTALGAGVLDAMTLAPGTFAYTATPSGGSAMAVTAATVLPVGSYTLTASFTPSNTLNYNPATATISFTVSGIYTLTVTVTPQTASRNFATPNPAFSYSVTGFQYGDTSAVLTGAPIISALAQLNSPGGTYPVTATQGTLSGPNYYVFSFVNAALTVLGNVPQIITFYPMSGVSMSLESQLTLTAHSTSGQPVTYAVTGPVTLAGSVLTLTGTGPVSVTASQPGNSTFAAASSVTQSFTVQP